MNTTSRESPQPQTHPPETRAQRTLHIVLLAMAFWTWGVLVPYSTWHACHQF